MVMAFLENLGKRVGEAAQAAAKKSGELVEITKLNVNINSEEDKIQKLYAQIGKSVYENFCQSGAAEDYIKEACEAITVHEQNVNSLREKIAEVKGTKACIACGAEMDRAQLFCSKCGARNEIPQAPVQPEAPETPAAANLTCPACGSALAAGSAFCTNCGTRL
jgi:predicted nucleic acid-binding Zn ribbon protein